MEKLKVLFITKRGFQVNEEHIKELIKLEEIEKENPIKGNDYVDLMNCYFKLTHNQNITLRDAETIQSIINDTSK